MTDDNRADICKVCRKTYQIYGTEGICDDCMTDLLVIIEKATSKFRNEVTDLVIDWVKHSKKG